MNWKDVTVWQWQQIQNLLSKEIEGDTELDIAVKTLAILKNQTEAQIDSLSISDLKKELEKIKFITTTMPEPKPKDFIKINGKMYRCIYDIKNLPYARYLESKHFGTDISNNLHKIAASMVMPMKLTWRGWKLAKYDASKHEQYANDLLGASFESVYGSIVFFCQVFANSIINSRDYLKEKLIKEGLRKEEAELTMITLCEHMDGFIKLPSLQNTNGLDLKKFTNLKQFKHLMTCLILSPKMPMN